jgi:hypothetical protein
VDKFRRPNKKMAKSIRSKTGRRNRTERRVKLHEPVETERLLKLAELQSAENCKSYEFHPRDTEDAMDIDLAGTLPTYYTQ